MSLRSISLAGGALTLVASGGQSWSVSPASVLATYALQVGTKGQKIAATLNAISAEAALALGQGVVPVGSMACTFDESKGNVLSVVISNL